MIELDGGYQEGGGQILRTAVGLSAVTGRPCRIFNIRRGRKNPGLRAQHLSGIQAVAGLCGGDLKGAQMGSPEIVLHPRGLSAPDRFAVRVPTAGSVCLVLQAVMIPLSRSPRPVSVEVEGGTHVRWAPVVEYFRDVFAHYLGRMGCRLAVGLERHGFYPRGGGRVRVTARPGGLKALDLVTRGGLCDTTAVSVATEDLKEARVAERQLEGAAGVLPLDRDDVVYAPSASTGTAIFMRTRYESCVLGASALGERGRPAEKVGRDCARAMREQMSSGACLDQHMADQIVPYMALAGGGCRASVAEVTDHCRTNMWVVEQFLPVRFEVDEETRLITCTSVAE